MTFVVLFVSLAVAVASTLPVLAATPQNITGYIYCDNRFDFWFNGKLIASDPLDFTPHNGVSVSFEWDGASDRVYAILCQDYATASGYEYTQTVAPQLGDGGLIASFSDGTQTSSSWKRYVVTYGPTAASIQAGCSASNLAPCAVADYGTPTGWNANSFDDSAWSAVTTYTQAQAGWGTTPSFTNGVCCTSTSPLTRAVLGCSVNSTGNAVAVTAAQCLNPKTVLESTGATFIWGTDLEYDNKVLFRYRVAANSTVYPSNGAASWDLGLWVKAALLVASMAVLLS